MMNNNDLQLKLGNATEKFIAKTLRNFGYWAYILPKKVGGQPFDIIGVKRNIVWFIDGKHVEEGKVSFTFDRIEPNQLSSMKYAIEFAKVNENNVGFSIFFDRDKNLRWLTYTEFVRMHNLGMKSVNMNDLELFEEVLKYEDNN